MVALIQSPCIPQLSHFGRVAPVCRSSPPSLQKPRRRRPVAFPAAAPASLAPGSPSMACLASSSTGGGGGGGMSESKGSSSLLMDFPYLSPSHRDLMVDLLSSMESRLGTHLLPSAVPPDVLSFQNEPGTCKGALDIRSGADGSPVDFILESWLHCELPFGVLDITTLLAYLNAETDAPHLLIEFIQNGPSSLVLFLDLPPRRDLVLHPDYLDHFYEQSTLDRAREELESAPEVMPYRSASLYIRSILSPTGIAVKINCGAEGVSSMEEVMRVRVASAAKEVMGVWLERCAGGEREVMESDRAGLVERDRLIKTKSVEIDVTSNLPRLFGPEVADRVLAAIQNAV